MKTIQITIGDELLARLDQQTGAARVARSAFIREAVEHELERGKIRAMIARHAEGYRRMPQEGDDLAFSVDRTR